MNNVILPSQRKDADMTDLYNKVIDYKNIELSYKNTQKGSRKYRKENILFDMCRERNLVNIWKKLKNETYEVGEYIRFKVYEPKERVVSAPKIHDKVVQFAVHEVLKEMYKPIFISTSFACVEGGGTHKAVDKVQHDMRFIKWKYGDGWVLKMDVAKFFYSINRSILKKILRKKIKDYRYLELLDKIIDSSPEGERGIPLGNVTSQDFANIYLNELDQYCKRYLKIKHYTRYMDDIIIVVPRKEEAQTYLKQIKWFLKEELDLETNKKTKIFPISQGVNAYGYKIWTTHKLVRNQSKKAMKRRIKAMDRKLKEGKMDKKDIIQAVNSWLGHARHSNSFNLCKKIFAKYPYIQIEKEGEYFGTVFRNS
ncbi:reverse transcriptase domain-containing protein [Tepidibacter thalassicus]|nr:reverse transcriptase domain-containing protein [Tepidibacter thalassicus]